MKANLILAAATALALGPVATAEDKHDHAHGDDHKAEAAEHAEGHGTHEEGADQKKEHAGHDHDEMTGPNEGKILHGVSPHAEFFVTKDRKIQITFVDNHGKAVAPPDYTITMICGKRSAPTRLAFALTGKVFTSDKALPEGQKFPTIVQFKPKDGGKPVRERFNLNLADCATCNKLEYACTCDHGH